ncbi:MAG: C39 family peptidase [Clostridia bacterium]|nr:C39 family peptidase [Clostridia bacterium]
MMKNKRKLNVKKIVVPLLIIILLIVLCIRFHNLIINYISNNSNIEIPKIQNKSIYNVIKGDYNKNYSGVGMQEVKDKDGYFSTFTTEDKNKKVYKEYKQNGYSSWSNLEYWGGTMTDNGCGITAIATILSGYNKNYTPGELRKKYYPVLDNEKISKELSSTFGITNSNFFYDTEHLSNTYIEKHLKSNRPILICVWNKPKNNRWTTSSHYMVLLATDGLRKGLCF